MRTISIICHLNNFMSLFLYSANPSNPPSSLCLFVMDPGKKGLMDKWSQMGEIYSDGLYQQPGNTTVHIQSKKRYTSVLQLLSPLSTHAAKPICSLLFQRHDNYEMPFGKPHIPYHCTSLSSLHKIKKKTTNLHFNKWLLTLYRSSSFVKR